MTDRKQMREVLEAEVSLWSRKTPEEIISELPETKAYQVNVGPLTYQSKLTCSRIPKAISMSALESTMAHCGTRFSPFVTHSSWEKRMGSHERYCAGFF
jgi:hypothetical protein